MTQSNPKNTPSHQAQYSKRNIRSPNQSLAEGAFLSAPRKARGGCPLAGPSAFWAGFCLEPLQPGCCDSRFAISSADPCSRGACPQRLARLPEACEAVADGSGGHPSALRRRGAGPPDRPSVAHGGSPCGISLQFDDAAAVALALFRVRLARWVLARLCSFVLTP